MHQQMATAIDQAVADIREIQQAARHGQSGNRANWPMIILKSPKGWTGPKTVDGLKTEGFWRSHQVPFSDMNKPGRLQLLEDWMRSYHPEELFDEGGSLRPELGSLAPNGIKRMSANPQGNGGVLMRPLRLPDICYHAIGVE